MQESSSSASMQKPSVSGLAGHDLPKGGWLVPWWSKPTSTHRDNFHCNI